MYKCECGREAKSLAGLKSHQRNCGNEQESSKKSTEFDVLNQDGSVLRTYSVEIHGEKAEDSAKMFSIKFNKNYVGR